MDNVFLPKDAPWHSHNSQQRTLNRTQQSAYGAPLGSTQNDDGCWFGYNSQQRALNRTQHSANSAPVVSTQDDDGWWGRETDHELDPYDSDDSTHARSIQGSSRSKRQSLSKQVAHGPTRAVFDAAASALAAQSAKQPITAEAAQTAVPSSPSNTTKDSTEPYSEMDMDVFCKYFKFLELEQAVQREKVALKKEQYEFRRKDQETKNTIALQRIALETRQAEWEHQRLFEKQRLDAEYRLAKLKSEHELELKAMHRNG
ncbi:hypothetical protein BGZ72_000854, partial [Mortierella alpina]